MKSINRLPLIYGEPKDIEAFVSELEKIGYGICNGRYAPGKMIKYNGIDFSCFQDIGRDLRNFKIWTYSNNSNSHQYSGNCPAPEIFYLPQDYTAAMQLMIENYNIVNDINYEIY